LYGTQIILSVDSINIPTEAILIQSRAKLDKQAGDFANQKMNDMHVTVILSDISDISDMSAELSSLRYLHLDVTLHNIPLR
jgi:hypothetical protein